MRPRGELWDDPAPCGMDCSLRGELFENNPARSFGASTHQSDGRFITRALDGKNMFQRFQ